MSEGGPSRNSADPARRAEPAVEVIRHGGDWEAGGISDVTVELAARAAFAVAPPRPASSCEVTIVLTDDAEMRELNRAWRGKDAPTNVLSFPAGDMPGVARPLGDVVVAYETTLHEANEAAIPLADHLSHLAVHGILHLLGFDHMDDGEAERMEDLERTALASLGIADPYQGGEAALAEVSS